MAKTTPVTSTPITQNRAERVLAFMVASAIGLSILSFLAVIIGTAAGLTRETMSTGIWATISLLPLIGLPLGLILVIVLIIVSGIRRGRETKGARK